MPWIIRSWLSAFLFTQCVEVPIYKFGARAHWGVAFGASALTHPIVWFVIPRFFAWDQYWTMVLVAEIFAVLAETLWLKAFRVERAFGFALVANASSVGLGFLSRYLFSWP